MAYGYRPIISKIRCTNPNSKGVKVRNYNFLRYIATREGVDLTKVRSMTLEEAVNENIDFNDAGEDVVLQGSNNEAYLKYMAFRPRSHGLFGNIDTEDFKSVAQKLNQVSEEKKSVYRGVVSLSSTDAEALGYKNIEKWNLYLKAVIPDIAKTLRLSPNDITWVAAFHMENEHPHVHYMLWDNRDKVQSPYIHISQQQACREICQKAMFSAADEGIIRAVTAAEREEYYSIQNASRKEITDYFKTIFADKEFVPGIAKEKLPDRISIDEHKKLNSLYKKILSSMPGAGRITYQYMPVECKAYIDQVTDIMLKRTDISKEYTAYISAVENIQKSLGKDAAEIRAGKDGAKNEIYNRTGNIVLKSIFDMKDYILEEQNSDRYEEDADDYVVSEEQHSPFEFFSNTIDSGRAEKELLDYVAEQTADERAHEYLGHSYSDSSSCKEDYIGLAKIYSTKSSAFYNPVKAEEFYLKALEQPADERAHEYLGHLYSDSSSCKEDIGKAVFHYQKCVEIRPSADAFTGLAKIYSTKSSVFYNPVKAEEFYLKALELDSDRSYLKLNLSRLYMQEDSPLFNYKKALDILEGISDNKGSVSLQKANIYNKPGIEIYDLEKAVGEFEASYRKKNPYAAYQLGRIATDSGSSYYNIDNGIEYLEDAVKLSSHSRYAGENKEMDMAAAHITLARVYLMKQGVHYDINKAEAHLKSVLQSMGEKEDKPYTKLTDYEKECKFSAYFNLARCEEERENIPKAACIYQKVIQTEEIDDASWTKNEGRYRLARIMISRKEYAQALQLISGYNIPDKTGKMEMLLAEVYEKEDSAYHNMDKAIKLYLSAAEKENTYAMVKLGKCYFWGLGVKKDRDAAVYWLKEAEERGSLSATEFLQKMEKESFNNFSYALLRQLLNSLSQTNQKQMQKLQEHDFKTYSKQVQKEERLHGR